MKHLRNNEISLRFEQHSTIQTKKSIKFQVFSFLWLMKKDNLEILSQVGAVFPFWCNGEMEFKRFRCHHHSILCKNQTNETIVSSLLLLCPSNHYLKFLPKWLKLVSKGSKETDKEREKMKVAKRQRLWLCYQETI